jgi:sterol desaturase/sphingolipid hydroxylase (fatty acid hydroxylase superfamily)
MSAVSAVSVLWALTHERTFFIPWAVQFVMSWVGFLIFAAWDYDAYSRGALEAEKLPSRHPIHLSPLPDGAADKARRLPLFSDWLPLALCPRVSVFWYTQLFMVPLVLVNQCVVWPLVSLLVVVPTWSRTATSLSAWGPWGAGALAAALPIMLVSDQLWYWGHRLMHTPFCWKHFHKMHHIAPQSAISATYVHPVEYGIFSLCIQLPFALAGFPVWAHAIPMGWGMVTGSGAHSGYGGTFANGEKHGTGHHLYHSANFGLLMVADMVWGARLFARLFRYHELFSHLALPPRLLLCTILSFFPPLHRHSLGSWRSATEAI